MDGGQQVGHIRHVRMGRPDVRLEELECPPGGRLRIGVAVTLPKAEGLSVERHRLVERILADPRRIDHRIGRTPASLWVAGSLPTFTWVRTLSPAASLWFGLIMPPFMSVLTFSASVIALPLPFRGPRVALLGT